MSYDKYAADALRADLVRVSRPSYCTCPEGKPHLSMGYADGRPEGLCEANYAWRASLPRWAGIESEEAVSKSVEKRLAVQLEGKSREELLTIIMLMQSEHQAKVAALTNSRNRLIRVIDNALHLIEPLEDADHDDDDTGTGRPNLAMAVANILRDRNGA